MATETRSFAVVPPGRAPWLTLLAIGLVLPLMIIGGVLYEQGGRQLPEVLAATSILSLLTVGLGALMRRSSVRIEAGQLVVRAAMYTFRLAPAALDLAQARVVDLDEKRELRPRWKTNGYALPGYYAGHFRSAGLHERLFCLLTSQRRVLVLPTRSGRRLLLSLQRPQALLDALRAMAPR
jgi:hypothetical protein